MSTKILHFTLGPVQGFVSQARRTRDFWAGSFLLSWLAGQAMRATLEVAGAKITFPAVGDLDNPKDKLLAAICGTDSSGPTIGTIPNRFRAQVPDGFDPKSVEQRVRDKWLELASAVWDGIPADVIASGNQDQGHKTEDIWNRQVSSFWEIAWVIGDEGTDDGGWLDLRKNWRSHLSSLSEGGDHCTIMSDYQELSGFLRSHHREQQDAFWEKMQQCKFGENTEKIGPLELRTGERLCAIALVKRLFPRLSKECLRKTIGFIPGGKYNRIGKWPSTSYMSAVPWLDYVAQDPKRRDALLEYAQAVKENTGDNFKRLCSEQGIDIDIQRVKPSGDVTNYCVGAYSLYELDGNLFNLDALSNARATPLSEAPVKLTPDGVVDPAKDEREKLLKALQQCIQSVDVEAPSFYAMLAFDGDRLGKLLQLAPAFSDKLSDALLEFAGGSEKEKGVSSIVSGHGGVTMYAGGDDVMALLPIDTAIQCAIDVRQLYQDRINEVGFPDDLKSLATGSAAIVLAHFHLPLRDVIAMARHYLDNIAKEKNGRDSLAVALFKNSGVTAQWVAKFQSSSPQSQPHSLLKLQKAIAELNFSTGFFYNLLQRYPMFSGELSPIDNLEIKRILFAEYCKGRPPKTAEDFECADTSCQILVDACRHHDSSQLQIGGALITRFVVDSTKGLSEGADL